MSTKLNVYALSTTENMDKHLYFIAEDFVQAQELFEKRYPATLPSTIWRMDCRGAVVAVQGGDDQKYVYTVRKANDYDRALYFVATSPACVQGLFDAAFPEASLGTVLREGLVEGTK